MAGLSCPWIQKIVGRLRRGVPPGGKAPAEPISQNHGSGGSLALPRRRTRFEASAWSRHSISPALRFEFMTRLRLSSVSRTSRMRMARAGASCCCILSVVFVRKFGAESGNSDGPMDAPNGPVQQHHSGCAQELCGDQSHMAVGGEINDLDLNGWLTTFTCRELRRDQALWRRWFTSPRMPRPASCCRRVQG